MQEMRRFNASGISGDLSRIPVPPLTAKHLGSPRVSRRSGFEGESTGFRLSVNVCQDYKLPSDRHSSAKHSNGCQAGPFTRCRRRGEKGGGTPGRRPALPGRPSKAVSVDLSSLLTAEDAVIAAGMLATWAYSHGAIDAAAALGISTRPRVIPLDEFWRVLRAGAGMVDSCDSLTRLNRQKGAVTIMVTHSLRDTEALPRPEDRAKAAGLMERCDTLILGASSHSELEAVRARKPLTTEEVRLISSWANPIGTSVDGTDQKHPGRGKYLIKIGHRIGVPVGLQLDQVHQIGCETAPKVSPAVVTMIGPSRRSM